jgi:hypothetical protein
MAKKLLAVFAVCCLSAVFVSAKSTRNSDLPDAADFDWDHFSYGWGVGAGLFQVKTIVTDGK